MIELFGLERKVIEPLCIGREEEVTLYACLEGHMGRVWVDNKENPICSVVLAGDFYFIIGSYLQSEQNHIVQIISGHRVYAIILDAKEWKPLLEHLQSNFPDSYKCFKRFAVDGKMEWFDKDKLRDYVNAVETEYHVERIDERIFYITQKQNWTGDFCSNFLSLDEFKEHGIGYVVMHGDEIISGASTYGYCEGRVEITIETKAEYRQKGLALACASALILESLEHNIFPRWDAANMKSVALAEKLGYRFKHEYSVYAI